MVAGAVRTDFILSAEIMAIALAELATDPIAPDGAAPSDAAVSLAAVALAITSASTGLVGPHREDGRCRASTWRAAQSRRRRHLGRGLVGACRGAEILSIVGIAAMIWVGGHILWPGSTHRRHRALPHHPRLADGAGAQRAGDGGFVEWLSRPSSTGFVRARRRARQSWAVHHMFRQT
jgi:predicted DNA repair protein MutK